MLKPKFEVLFLAPAREFLQKLDKKSKQKVIYNIDKSRYQNDPQIFKKLNEEIWEFRTLYNKLQYRLLAFWDKRESEKNLVVCTHGIIKKQDKVPQKDIERAEELRKNYLLNT